MKFSPLSSPVSGFILAAALTLALSSAQATPIPIVGSISFLGNAVVNTGDLATATSFTSFSSDKVDETSGAYSTLPALTGDPVTFPPTGFTFRDTPGTLAGGTLFSSMPVPSPLSTMPLWTFTTSGGVTYSFMASGSISVIQNSSFLDISGTGTAMITGGGTSYAATSGDWTVQETNTGAAFSFGATSGEAAAATPDHAASSLLMVLGLGGIGWGLKHRRRAPALAI
jgi:hypothetical protein